MQHLKEYDANRIYITFIINPITIPHKPFRCQIQRRPQKTMRLLILVQLNSQSKISQIQMPILINKNILWFQIPIKYFSLMQKLNCNNKLRQQHYRLFFRYFLFLLYQFSQISILYILQRKIQILIRLKGIIQWNDIWTWLGLYQTI